MSETTQYIFATSFQIAWDYLDAMGELGNPIGLRATFSIPSRPWSGTAKGDRSFSPIEQLPPTNASERSRDWPLRP